MMRRSWRNILAPRICQVFKIGGGWILLLTGLAAGDDFVGPFPSWANVKTDYGAVGDGRADDTVALQKAFDDLRLHRDHGVLYFPPGTYRLTRTIKTERQAHHDCMGVAIVGEDPATTILRWDGPPGGLMLQYDAWYSRISRLTLDGAGRAGLALAYGPAFSTYNETSDMVFRDAAVGMQMATGDAGQAENLVLRCQFLRCSEAGLRTVNFNSLDIWVWYCRFEDCGYGLYNGAGNFHAYENLFLRSKKADIGTANLMVFSFINNTSLGSLCFLDFSGGHTWGSPCSVTGNRILDPIGDRAIRLSNGGPYLVMDNVIKSRPEAVGPVVEMTWGDQTFIGNRYTVPVDQAVQEAGRFQRIDEQTVALESIDARLPALPATPPRREARIFEVPAGADAAMVQKAVEAAAAFVGERPVVHLPQGVYSFDQTIVIPAGVDLQLVGDGAAETATVIRWSGPDGGVVFLLKGPSHASLRDLWLQAPNGNTIRLEDCDQPGAKVYLSQLNVSGINPDQKARTGLLVNGLENADVLAQALQGGSYCEKWVHMVGGPRQRAGQTTPGQVGVYCGATGTADAPYTVTHGGRLIVRSVYHEMDRDVPQALLLNDSGMITIDATRFSYATAPQHPLIKVQDFRGSLALITSLLLPVNSLTTARIELRGDGSQTRLLALNNLFWVNELGVNADRVWKDESNPPAWAGLVRCNMNSGLEGATRQGGYDILDPRGSQEAGFIREMVQPLRQARLWLPSEEKPQGITHVLLHRLLCVTGKGGIGVELRRRE